MKRRDVLHALAAAATAAMLPPALATSGGTRIEVFKTETCGCCGAWVEHLTRAGFQVTVRNVPETASARKRLGMPESYGSCHTASVGGYTIEGHVPADEIKRLLATRPEAVGLAVPGMPVGSPGMEMGSRRDPYDVLLIDKAGRASVFAHYPKAGTPSKP
ncbi:MAG TPA: DUF411 domain-containing protein [Rhizobacter sp.]